MAGLQALLSSSIRLSHFRARSCFHRWCRSRWVCSSQSASDGPEPAYSKLVHGYQVYHHPAQFNLDYGQSLPTFDLAYEVWGELSPQKDNAILIHTGLSGSSHAKSHPENPSPGWWEKFIGHGPSYPIDLDRYFVVCTNVLGSCYGSTGPYSINPLTHKRYATDFPMISILDMVRAQFSLLDHLGIHRLYVSIGGSMGGMQSIAAAWLEPTRVPRVISISGCGRSAPSSIAMRYAQRSVLMADPNWKNGFYYDSDPPHTGMKLARQIATITYRSGPEWEQRFGRRRRALVADSNRQDVVSQPSFGPDFLIETYLDHQGKQFCLKYDANSLLYISKSMDLFDLTVEGLSELTQYQAETRMPNDEMSLSLRGGGRGSSESTSLAASSFRSQEIINSLAHTFRKFDTSQQFLILGVQTDILFPIELQRELVEAIRLSSSAASPAVTYFELRSPFGHDTFLIDLNGVGGAIRGFLS